MYQIQSAVKVNERTREPEMVDNYDLSPGQELTYNDRSANPRIDHTQLDR
jgi:hypothetical protein